MWHMCKNMSNRREEVEMTDNMIWIVGGFIFFLILFSLQYTMNKIYVVLKKIEINTRGGRIKHDDEGHY